MAWKGMVPLSNFRASMASAPFISQLSRSMDRAGLSPSVMSYILGVTVGRRYAGGLVTADEIGLPVEATGFVLPCGATAIWAG